MTRVWVCCRWGGRLRFVCGITFSTSHSNTFFTNKGHMWWADLTSIPLHYSLLGMVSKEIQLTAQWDFSWAFQQRQWPCWGSWCPASCCSRPSPSGNPCHCSRTRWHAGTSYSTRTSSPRRRARDPAPPSRRASVQFCIAFETTTISYSYLHLIFISSTINIIDKRILTLKSFSALNLEHYTACPNLRCTSRGEAVFSCLQSYWILISGGIWCSIKWIKRSQSLHLIRIPMWLLQNCGENKKITNALQHRVVSETSLFFIGIGLRMSNLYRFYFIDIVYSAISILTDHSIGVDIIELLDKKSGWGVPEPLALVSHGGLLWIDLFI